MNLSKQLESADCNLDVTNLDEKISNALEPAKLANAPGDSDDGLSDVDENVSMWCENDTKVPFKYYVSKQDGGGQMIDFSYKVGGWVRANAYISINNM